MSSYIPFEIQDLIIQRLPIKPLIRFISVCKAWKSLIKSSEFVTGYRYRQAHPAEHMMIKYRVGEFSAEEVKFVCYVDDDSFPEQKFAPTVPPLLQSLYVSKIADSSCGLLYLDCDFGEPDGSLKYMAVLWNPLIRKSIAVTVPTLPTDPEFFREADDIVGWPFGYVRGFGVCPQTNDPKLVNITYIEHFLPKGESISCIPFQVIVFTLSSGEWRSLSSNHLPRKSIEFETRSSRVIGQFIYWIAYDLIIRDDDGLRYSDRKSLIISFDLSNEVFKEIHLPNSLARTQDFLFIFRLKESLAVVEYAVHYLSEPCVVWMMENDDSKSFTKLFTIEAPHASIRWPLGFSKSGKLIFKFWDDEASNAPCPLVVYEPCSRHIKHLAVCGNRGYFYGSSYTESLLLLDHEDGRIIRCGEVWDGHSTYI